uniref:Rnase l inhibitor n=1 Tax=Rhizophora mucronata TaxID=61149 RepID=A0A2P2LVL2_RHIMU
MSWLSVLGKWVYWACMMPLTISDVLLNPVTFGWTTAPRHDAEHSLVSKREALLFVFQ